MPSTYTTNNGIEKIGTGEQSGTWGDTTNLNFDILDQALDGLVTITATDTGSSGSPNTLPITDGTLSDGRNRLIIITDGGDLGGSVYYQLTPADAEKIVFLRNSLSGSQDLILFQGTYNAARDLIVPAGKDVIVKFSGTGTSTAVVAPVFADLSLDAATIASADINGGTIDGVTIGVTSVATVINVDNLKLDGNTLSSTDTNGNVVLAPNGDGDVQLDADTVRVGDSNNDVTITTNGTGDLTLNTNGGTDSGSIEIQDGANTNIIVTANGTGKLELANGDITTSAASGSDAAGQDLTIQAGASTGNAAGGDMIFQTTPAGAGSGTNLNSYTTVLTLTDDSKMQIGTSTAVDSVLDEDDMNSDSATALATQQSIKAYVDSQVGTVDTLAEILANGNTTGGTDIAVSANDDITFTDSSKAIFGDDSDLQIYHDGSASYVKEVGTGPLNIQMEATSGSITSGAALLNFLAKTGPSLYTAANLSIHQPGSGEGIGDFRFSVGDGAGVSTEILRVNSTGIDVTGDVGGDSATISGDLTVDTDTLYVDSTNDRVGINNTGAAGYDLYVGNGLTGTKAFALNGQGSSSSVMNLDLLGGGTGNPTGRIAFSSSTEALSFSTGDNASITTAMTIDSSQRVLIGYTANTSVADFNSAVQVVGQGTADFHGAAISAVGFSNNSNGAYLNFGSGRSNTAGTFTSVANDDTIGQINFAAADGTDMNSRAALIMAQIDGAPSSNDTPGRIIFSTTADGASSPTERMRIHSSGDISMSGSSGTVGTLKGRGSLTISDDHGDNTGGAVAFHYTGNGGYSEIYIENNNTLVLNADPTAAGSNTSIKFRTDDTLAAIIDDAQRLLIGHSSSIRIGSQESVVQVLGSSAGGSSYSAVRYTNTANSSKLTLGKSRAGSIGSNVIVQDGDTIGIIDFAADDGTNLEHQVASIQAQMDGTPGANDLPGRLVFLTTTDGANSVSERMKILSTGTVTINTPSSGSALAVNVLDNTADGFVVQQGSNKYISVDTTNTDEEVILGNATTNPSVIVKGTNLNINSSYIDFSGSVSTPNTAAAIYRPADNTLAFSTLNAEAMRIDSSQRVLIGTSSSINGYYLQVAENSGYAGVSALRYTNDAFGAYLNLGKSRTTTIGGNTIVQDNDVVGYITFSPNDGTDLVSISSQIQGEIDGTPGANDVPGRLVFKTTADGASSSTERMRITNGGRVGINTVSNSSAPTGWLTIDNDINSADILTNKASYHIALGLDGGHTNNYIGGIGFGDVVTSEIQAAIAAVDAGTSAATSLAFVTGNTSAVNEAMRIDSSQRVLIGLTSDIGTGHKLQVNDDITIMTFDGATTGADGVRFIKSRASSPGSTAIVGNGDDVGFLDFRVDDGTDYSSRTAVITSSVDGTPGTNDTPGNLRFFTTADGASSVTERMRIDNAGRVMIAGAAGNVNAPTSLMGDMNAYLRVGSSGAMIGSLVKYSYGPNTNVDGAVFQLQTGTNGNAAYLRITCTNYQGARESIFFANNASGSWNLTEVNVADHGGSSPNFTVTTGTTNPTVTVSLPNTSYSGGFLDVTASSNWELTLA